jgi:TRAP-type C4-dicarboxylate transport system permease large subunit
MTLAAFFIVLGFFLEGVAITVMTLPIVLPLIKQAGFDPIWFGVFLVVMVEMATITPPVGFNLFVIQSLTNFQLGRVALAAFPFFLLMCLGVILMYIFPQIVLWLPSIL